MEGYVVGGALALALACGGVATAAEPLAGKGDAVTITGCVLAGTQDGSVVLTHVSEAAAGGGPREAWLGAEGMAEPGGAQQVAYWLNHDSVKKVREHIGHRVEIKGHVSDVSQGNVTVDREPGKDGRDNKVTVEARVGPQARSVFWFQMYATPVPRHPSSSTLPSTGGTVTNDSR